MYPGTPLPQFKPLATHVSAGFHEVKIEITSHTGTHVDAPFHILSNGQTIHEYPLDQFSGKGYCIDVKNEKTISSDSFADMPKDVEFIFFHSGYDKLWGKEDYLRGYPHLSEETCERLIAMKLKGIGLDFISPDPLHSQDLPAHHTLLEHDILIYENLKNLSRLIGTSFIFQGYPLPWPCLDGCPVRAIANLPND